VGLPLARVMADEGVGFANDYGGGADRDVEAVVAQSPLGLLKGVEEIPRGVVDVCLSGDVAVLAVGTGLPDDDEAPVGGEAHPEAGGLVWVR